MKKTFSHIFLDEGGPFTIGRAIHSNRLPTLTAWFGGVAVYASALSPEDRRKLAEIGRPGTQPSTIALTNVSNPTSREAATCHKTGRNSGKTPC